MRTIQCSAFPVLPIAVSLCAPSTRRPSSGPSGGSTAGHHPTDWIRRWLEASTMASALSMGRIWSRESEFGRASSGPTSLRPRATGSKRTRQTRARPGRQTGCRTSHEFADWRFVLPHGCPHLRIEIWGTLGQNWPPAQMVDCSAMPHGATNLLTEKLDAVAIDIDAIDRLINSEPLDTSDQLLALRTIQELY